MDSAKSQNLPAAGSGASANSIQKINMKTPQPSAMLRERRDTKANAKAKSLVISLLTSRPFSPLD
jgi:hypothetical protein